ncbi:hypothetical protein OV450_7223 [Actinobacteria bacterium OV450]|nr:hypothetical protein OV450_7223 [Actinobacteria bacterium OV450]
MDTPSSYRGFRYTAEIIAHAVWLYFRFPLSFREVEELLFERGITVSYDRCASGAPSSGRPTPTDCAAGDPAPGTNGTSTRSSSRPTGGCTTSGGPWTRTATSSTSSSRTSGTPRPPTGSSEPRVIVTDMLRPYGAAHREVMPSVEHRSSYLYNRAESSHQPTRQRERAMKSSSPDRRTGRSAVDRDSTDTKIIYGTVLTSSCMVGGETSRPSWAVLQLARSGFRSEVCWCESRLATAWTVSLMCSRRPRWRASARQFLRWAIPCSTRMRREE